MKPTPKAPERALPCVLHISRAAHKHMVDVAKARGMSLSRAADRLIMETYGGLKPAYMRDE